MCGRVCLLTHLCGLNEELGGTICLTVPTKDDEIVSKRKSTCVCPLWSPCSALHRHPHKRTCAVVYIYFFDSLLFRGEQESQKKAIC